MHILLFFSVLLTVLSSSLLTLVFENKNIINAICYFAAILFAEVILTYEILSVFFVITPQNVISINIVMLLLSLVLWNRRKNKPDFLRDIQIEWLSLKKILKRDKWLFAISVSFILFIVGSLIFMYFMPANDEDALSYHVARLPFWFSAGNLKHFITTDIRAIIMPINSEIFYFWAYSFIKSDIFVRLFSFLSYLLFVAALRGFLKILGFSLKTFLWVFFGISAMQNVMFAITGTETNIAIAALVLASLFLFIDAVKNNKIIPLYFSSLLFALAVGVKTPALLAAPAVFLVLAASAYLYKKKNCYKPLGIFAVLFVLNFLIFSSYNYILNFIDFGNFITSSVGAEMHKFSGGIKGFIANIIRFSAMFFDFTGMPFGVQLWRVTISGSMLLMALFGIQPDINTIIPDSQYFELGNNFENTCGLGVLSFLVFIPSLIFAFREIKFSGRNLILGAIVLGFIINILVLSLSLGYMIFSVRFVMFFVMIASPIMVYMLLLLKNKTYKKVIAIIMIYTFTFSYYFYERRFTPYLMYIFYKNPSVSKFKEKILCANIDYNTPSQTCKLINIIKKDKGNVLYFANSGVNIYFPKHIETKDSQIDFAYLESAEEDSIDWDKYLYIVVPNVQLNTNVQNILNYKKFIKLKRVEDKILFEYDNNLFANCTFVNFKNPQKPLLYSNEEKNITSSRCRFKPEILKKHGYELIEKIDSYDKIPEEQINVYKKKSSF